MVWAMRFAPLHRETGFSLVEVLVAMAIFALGLGAISLMLLASAHGTVEAQNQTTAAMHAASLAQLILLNPAAKGHYLAPAPASGGNCLAPEVCSGTAWAAANFARWQHGLEQSLAHATGLVCLDATPEDGSASQPACDGVGPAVVKIFWPEPQNPGEHGSGQRRIVLPVAD